MTDKKTHGERKSPVGADAWRKRKAKRNAGRTKQTWVPEFGSTPGYWTPKR